MSKKRILIVSQYFYPEQFKISELAFELKNRGHHVDVLTSIPNYPEGKFKEGYGILNKRIETINGVKIYRALSTPRGKNAAPISLAFNYLSYMLNASLWILFYFIFKKKYDSIIAFEVSPITQVFPAIILKKIRKSKLYTWVLDIWPDSVVSTIGEEKSKLILPFLNRITNYVYKESSILLTSSERFKELINRDHDYSDKIIHFPNWSDDILSMPEQEIPKLPEGYIIMMAGNIADGIGVTYVEELVKSLSDIQEIKFVFVGGGAKVKEMSDYFRNNNLNNVTMVGQYPLSHMSSFYNKADAMLLSLKPIHLPHLNATVPARLQSYMASGKPIYAMIGDGAADIIKQSECGFVVPAGDYRSLATIIRRNYKKSQLLNQMGLNGRKVFEEKFTINKCIDNLEYLISD